MTVHVRRMAAVMALGAVVACEKQSPPAERATAGERVLEVTGMEYAFRAPDSVDAGRTVIRLRNEGKVLHEMIVLRLRPGTTIKALADAQGAGASVRQLIEGGNAVLFAPGNTTGSGELVVDFVPGTDYALWCNFSDAEGKPAHSTLGMFKVLHVRASAAEGSARQVPIVNVEAIDYAFRLPDTLDAGETELRIHNVGTQRHEISFGRLARGRTAKQFFTDFLAKRSVDAYYDDDGAVLTAYPGDTNTTSIRTRFESGRTYVIYCEFQDTPDAPHHTSLGMFKEIVVR